MSQVDFSATLSSYPELWTGSSRKESNLGQSSETAFPFFAQAMCLPLDICWKSIAESHKRSDFETAGCNVGEAP